MSEIIVTGATGFVGKNLLNYLGASRSIKTLTRAEVYDFNVTYLNNANTVIHLAGKAHDLKRSPRSAEYYQINFELTCKLYDAFLLSDAKKFIFMSSVKAVADSVEGILNEDAIPEPKTDYGKSKLMAEQYIRSRELPEGKSYYILRPCLVHGPGNKGNLNLLYQFVKKGIPYPLAGFDNRRSFLSVDNLCFIIKELIERDDIPLGVYQVADDEALSTNTVVMVLANSLNLKSHLWKIKPSMVTILAKIGDWLHLPLTTNRLSKLTESYVVDNKKIKQALNKELPFTSIEGLKITASSFNRQDRRK